jgi:mannose-1-phosphate guanylyltransferase
MTGSVFSRQLFSQHNVYGVVLCGGSGTRLWPLSRQNCAKQFLALGGNTRTLLQTSLDRLESMIPPQKRWLVLSPSQRALAEEQTKPIIGRCVVEPEARNTAPAVALAAWQLLQHDPDSTMVILSADHAIANISGFEESLARAVSLAAEDHFVVLGIRPTGPATEFGYIETSTTLEPGGFKVQSFREKPNQATAEEFLRKGTYLWNAGMFIWKTRTFWKTFSQLQPEMAALIESTNESNLPEVYAKLQKLPIDIAFMEKASNVACVPALFDWNDVGSWAAVRECFPLDEGGNATAGDVLAIDSRNSVIHSSGPFVATVGISDLVVVATHDAVLVMPRDASQDVKRVITHLQSRGRTKLL